MASHVNPLTDLGTMRSHPLLPDEKVYTLHSKHASCDVTVDPPVAYRQGLTSKQ